MTTFSVVYLLSFLCAIPLWWISHKGLLGESVCEKMAEEARKQGIDDILSDKGKTKTLVFILGVLTVTPIVNTVLAVLVIKSVMFK